MSTSKLVAGQATLELDIEGDALRSLGAVRVNDTPLRNPANRFLPWFDTFSGHVFNRFRMRDVQTTADGFTIQTVARAECDYPFREQRDVANDLVFRNRSWDASPREAGLDIQVRAADLEVGGIAFNGFTYWYEYRGDDDLPVHRLLDRQTWELGGGLTDTTLLLRHNEAPPVNRIGRDDTFTTSPAYDDIGGAGYSIDGHPVYHGGMWPRWVLLPGFDMQYGGDGVLVHYFDRVSLIRSLIESSAGEDWIRYHDLHLFEAGTHVSTNPRTVLYAAATLDEIDAVNLWTRFRDREAEKARSQFKIGFEPAPRVYMHDFQWTGYRWDSSYDATVELAAEFGIDIIAIDGFLENGIALREKTEQLLEQTGESDPVFDKFFHQSMCCNFDYEVADAFGGAEALTALCARAAANGVGLTPWCSLHLSPRSVLCEGATNARTLAVKENGRHADSGNPDHCCPVCLSSEVGRRALRRIPELLRENDLSGIAIDTFASKAWWQIDVANGSFRPQFDQVAGFYANLVNNGLLALPESYVTFSNHSCAKLMLDYDDYYRDPLHVAFGYNSYLTGKETPQPFDHAFLRGEQPLDALFRHFAHRHMPRFTFQNVPRREWRDDRVAELKELIRTYKTVRDRMQHRTVLKERPVVEWSNSEDAVRVWFVLEACKADKPARDAATGTTVTDGVLRRNRVYFV